jgi:hypothetical protein
VVEPVLAAAVPAVALLAGAAAAVVGVPLIVMEVLAPEFSAPLL